ncbi:hypothetical protein GCM10009823_01590 [Brevibacterium salitolerans]|uniref:Uncharacterized protein n=1 Tax=Brevibacterium salitolerans TaxID=1403566 RepID=A0ABN2W9K7_9MICO
MLRRWDREGLDPRRARTVEHLRPGAVRTDGDDVDAGPRAGMGIEDGLGEGSGTGGKEYAAHGPQSRRPRPRRPAASGTEQDVGD